MKYKAKITYTIDKSHSDIKCMPDWTEWKVYEHEEEYAFDDNYWFEDSAIMYIKHDLKLIAGGGYNTSHIHNVTITIEQKVGDKYYVVA